MSRSKKPLLLMLAILVFASVISSCGVQGGQSDEAKTHEPPNEPKISVPRGDADLELAPKTDPFGNHILQATDEDVPFFPLYAMLPDREIFLYGIYPHGMVLFAEGRGQYLDWSMPFNNNAVPPRLILHDFDKDGTDELIVILHSGRGSGVSISDLHILKNEGEMNSSFYPIFTTYSLLGSDIEGWFGESPSLVSVDDGNIITFEFLGNIYTMAGEYAPDGGAITGIEFAPINSFEFDGEQISVSVEIGVKYENFATLLISGTIEADVVFDGAGFSLGGYQLR